MDDELSPGKVTLDNLFGTDEPEPVEPEKTLKEKFEESFIPEPNSGCWLWEANVNLKNYGQIRVNKTMKGAHRVSYELYKGEFDQKLHIRHKCDNTCCVNPDHLEPGTHKDNMNDKVKRGRQSSKLSEEQVIAIFNDNRSIKEIGKDYGITNSQVSCIKTGMYWSHLTGKKYEKSYKQLSEEQVIAIFNDNRTTEKIAKYYGTVVSNVSKIKTGKIWSHITGKKYEKNHLMEDQVKEIYIKTNNGYKVKDLAKEYNMSTANIYDIKNGRKWGWFTKDIKI